MGVCDGKKQGISWGVRCTRYVCKKLQSRVRMSVKKEQVTLRRARASNGQHPSARRGAQEGILNARKNVVRLGEKGVRCVGAYGRVGVC